MSEAQEPLEAAMVAGREEVRQKPASAFAHANLGTALKDTGQLDEAIACYRKAIELDPKFAWARHNLGDAFLAKGQFDQAIACYRKAIELDPKFALAHHNLGVALQNKGQFDEAIACWRKATELDPKLAAAHAKLGAVLCDIKRNYDAAIACFAKAIELDPRTASLHYDLGNALKGKGQVDKAIACYRKAIDLDPKFAKVRNNLGEALATKGQIDAAIACWRKAIELDPKYAKFHYNLGVALALKGQIEEATACWRKSIDLDPAFAEAHSNLGIVLGNKGQVHEAIASFRKAIELGFAPARPLLAQAERAAAAQDRFADFQNGRFTPASNEERLAMAEGCRVKKLNRTATGLYAAAFAADPNLADDLQAAHRYNAACFASLAAAGHGDDAAKLDDNERTRLRQQALDWLRADVALRGKQLESGKPADRAEVQQALRHWQQDTDLAEIRDAAALAKLPAEEQKAFTQLWANVAALHTRAEIPAVKEEKPCTSRDPKETLAVRKTFLATLPKPNGTNTKNYDQMYRSPSSGLNE